jgi:hypothetical protein
MECDDVHEVRQTSFRHAPRRTRGGTMLIPQSGVNPGCQPDVVSDGTFSRTVQLGDAGGAQPVAIHLHGLGVRRATVNLMHRGYLPMALLNLTGNTHGRTEWQDGRMDIIKFLEDRIQAAAQAQIAAENFRSSPDVRP